MTDFDDDDTDQRDTDPSDALRAAGLPVRPCGLNADWCVRAWHLGPSTTPNMVSGDLYLTHDPVDRHDACAWYVVRRTLDEDTDDMSDELLVEDMTLDIAIALARTTLS